MLMVAELNLPSSVTGHLAGAKSDSLKVRGLHTALKVVELNERRFADPVPAAAARMIADVRAASSTVLRVGIVISS